MTFMLSLLPLAQAAAQSGEVPVAAAVLAADGTVLAMAHNEVEALTNLYQLLQQRAYTANDEKVISLEAFRKR